MLALLVPLLLCPPVPAPPDFPAQLEQARVGYGLVASANASRLLEGDLEGATRALLEAVPADERSAADALVTGELLRPLDRELAFAMHAEAFVKEPQARPVRLAWALAQHGAGAFAEAEALYAELLALEPGPEDVARLNALRADCLLRLDRPEEACAAWRAAGASSHQDAIEAVAAQVHAPEGPDVRRCALLQRARAEGADAVAYEELLLLDLHWDLDPWSADVHTEYAAHDLQLARRALGEDSARSARLAFLARWTSPGRRFEFDDQIPKLAPPADHGDEIRAKAEALRLIGERAELPEGRLAGALFEILVDNEVVSPEELLGWHAAELRRRAQSREGDVDAMRALLALYEQTWDDELEPFRRFGWTRYGDVECALGLLRGQRDALRPRDLMLMQASAANPNDVRLLRLALEASEREGDLLVDPIARLAMAEFARLEECHRVDTLFRRLEAALRDRK